MFWSLNLVLLVRPPTFCIVSIADNVLMRLVLFSSFQPSAPVDITL